MIVSREHLLNDSLTATAFDPRAAGEPPARARAVVVGAGIVGASVALHLAELGWADTVVLERGRVSSGSTWHAAGLVSRTRTTHVQTEVASYSGEFYAKLAARSGVDIGHQQSGALLVAQTAERLTELRYALTMAHHHGLAAEELAPAEIAARWPALDPRGLEGGVLFADDATVNPGAAAYATAKAAAALGVRFVEGCRVTGFRLAGGRVTGVETERGTVECEVVVLAAGLWTRELGLLAGARVPLHAAEHVWSHSEPVAGVSPELPIVRDLDDHLYIRHYRGGVVVGAFEDEGRPRSAASIPPGFAFGEFPADPAYYAHSLGRARQLLPALADARVTRYLNAPESFTPDTLFLLGETAEVAGLFIAAGLNSQGIMFGPGLGKTLAEWIEAGAPTIDAAEVDVRRFAPAQANARYLFERTRETLGRLYAMHWPFLQPRTARGLRTVPLHERLAAAGACFGETAGWERANWYARPGEEARYRYSYGRQNWFAAAAEEHRAAREAVALFDLSAIAKFRVEGPTALASLQRICTADLDRAPGSVAYTCILNERGGVEADLTVTRLRDDAFLLIAPTVTQNKLDHWLHRHAQPGTAVADMTSACGTLAVMGPRSRELLAGLTDAPLDDAAFPFATARRIDVGWASAIALRMSFVGELGWELYAPVEYLPILYDEIVRAGAGLGLRHAGYHALDSLRAEKGFLHWGPDTGPSYTPRETGLGFTVAAGKAGGFVGAEALEARAAEPLRRRLVCVKLADPEPPLYHGESLFHDGRLVGRVTSGAYGHTLGASVGLAFLECEPAAAEDALAAGTVEVEVAGRRVPAVLSRRAFYDPEGRRMRGGPASS